MPNWLSQLKNPPAAFRETPFWAWNALLDKKELVRQVGELQRGGMGGFFMHVRYGLETEYLSPEFMDCVKAVVAEARKRGMEAWLYDEDRWPSGFAGGIVTANPEFRVKCIQWEEIPAARFTAPPPDSLRCFTARLEGSSIARDVKPLPAGTAPEPGTSVLVYRVRTGLPGGWFNHTAYVDAMNPDAIKAFLDCTHEAYKKAVGDEFGKTIPGIFTDEPNYGAFSLEGDGKSRAYPWTTRLPAEFSKRMGYDLLDHLVEISHRVDGCFQSKARHDYRRVACELYTEAFSKQIGEWCGRNNLEFTGHELAEESLNTQNDQVGACMPHYEHFQRPGIDILCEQSPEILTAKQAVSVASQLGRNRVLSEIYGCTGWDATFELYKHIGDWHQVLGVNHFCPHLSWYSAAGGAKRDYPASIFYQSPWWADHKLLNEYFGRLSLALSQGQAVREVAVIHPIESAWLVQTKSSQWQATGYSESLNRVCDTLFDRQFDYDFADESLLAKHGSVAGGGDAPRLKIGLMSYRAAVVPECATLRRATVEMLEKFADAGGKIVFVGQRPELMDCQPSDRPGKLAARSLCVADGRTALTAALDDSCREVIVEPVRGRLWMNIGEKFWTHCRRTDAGEVLFACNMNRRQGGTVKFRWRAAGRIQEIDLATGKPADVAGIEHIDGRQVWQADLAPTGSRLYICANEPAASPRPLPARPVELARVNLAPEWSYSLDEPNAINLDYAQMRIVGKDADWRPRKPLWQHERDLRAELGFPDNARPAEQPYIWLKNLSPKSAAVELRFEIPVEQPPAGPLSLAIEHPERFAIAVNGKPVAGKPRGWFIDRSFEVVPLAGVKLNKGVNELALRTDYRQHHWLEEIYLTGKFGARAAADRVVVAALPGKLAIGDWVSQGLAMYSGAVTYSQSVRVPAIARGAKVVLRMDRPKATVIRVAVNGKRLGLLGWQPWAMDVTRAVKPGVNRIEITLVSSRRNLLGPLHHVQKNPIWTGPGEFRTTDATFVPGYNLVAYGLLGEVCLTVER